MSWRRCLILLAAAILYGGVGTADDRPAGILYGPGHSYMLEAATGWVLDSEGGASQGLHAVFYPRGSSWSDSLAAIYTTAVERRDGESLDQFINRELAPFRSDGVAVETQTPIITADGKTAAVRFLTGGSHNSFEAIAYVPESKVIALIVLTARDQQSFGAALLPFAEVVRSYRFLTDSVRIER